MSAALGTGLGATVGIAQESAYGIFTTPTRFLEFLTEGIVPDRPSLETRSLGDQFVRTGRRRAYIKTFGGQIEVDFMTQGMGILLLNALGAATTAQVGSTAEYTHTFVPDAVGLAGKSLTVQVGKPSVDGTVYPFNYLGGKLHAWSLNQALDQNLKLQMTFDFKNLSDISSALAAASYPADNTPLAFLDATVTIDGVGVCLKTVNIAGTRAMNMDRRCLGNNKREPLANGEFAITGQFDKEFEGTAEYVKFLSGAVAKLVMTHTYGQIATTGNPFKLVTTIEALEYTGGNPTINGSEVLMQALPFKALLSAGHPLISFELHTSDVTP